MHEIYCSKETEGPADADFVSPSGILLDSSKDRLDNFGVGDKVQLDYNHTKSSTDKPIDGDIIVFKINPIHNINSDLLQ